MIIHPISEFLNEINKPRLQRKGFTRRRKQPFSITDERINELYDRYFTNLSLNQKQFTVPIHHKDLYEILYLLRVHFQIWLEIEGQNITIYQEFPKRFRLTKEVNITNHPYTPKTFPKDMILYFGEDHYGVCNRSKGIPLSEIPPNKERNKIRPVVQINYDFIEVFDDLS